MKTYGGVDVQIHVFLTTALVGGGWLALLSGKELPVPTGKRKTLVPTGTPNVTSPLSPEKTDP
jgi:hypothetical protein